MSAVWLKLIPSSISSLRIVIGLAFYWLPAEWRLPAAAVAALTDLVDGPASRWLKVDGKFGQILDPIADKIFLFCVLLTALLERRVTWWEMALVGTRDISVLLACGVLGFVGGWSAWTCMRPRLLGKLTTVVQIAFVLLMVAGFEDWSRVLVFVAAGIGAAAFVDYVLAFRRTPESQSPGAGKEHADVVN